MSTIADRLKNLYDSMVIANSVTNEFTQALPDCYEAVEEKGGTIPAEPTAANLPDAIESIPTSVGVTLHDEKDINFIDHKGIIVASYTFAEALELSALPTANVYTNLTFLGWQFTLQEVKFYAGKKCRLCVGALYAPTDGFTHLYITIPTDNFEFSINIYTNSGWSQQDPVVINWGDGSAETRVGRGTPTHTYATAGDYHITIDFQTIYAGENNSFSLNAATSKINGCCYKKIYPSVYVLSVGMRSYAYAVEEVSCSGTNATGLSYYNLPIPALIFKQTPNNTYTSEIITRYVCLREDPAAYISGYYAARPLTIVPPLAETVTTIPIDFYRLCISLKSVYIPASVTYFNGRVFYDCWNMREIYLYCETLPTLSNQNAFSNMNSQYIVDVHIKSSLQSEYAADTNWAAIMAMTTKFNFIADL